MIDQFVAVATEILAVRAGDERRTTPSRRSRPGPCSGCGTSRPRACASTWTSPPAAAEVRERVTADVRRAARLIDAGLRSFL